MSLLDDAERALAAQQDAARRAIDGEDYVPAVEAIPTAWWAARGAVVAITDIERYEVSYRRVRVVFYIDGIRLLAHISGPHVQVLMPTVTGQNDRVINNLADVATCVRQRGGQPQGRGAHWEPVVGEPAGGHIYRDKW